jgi:molybdopterin-synthase adenylyltransferase
MNLEKKSKPRLKTTLYSLLLPDGRILILFTPEEQLILPKLSLLQKELLILADGNSTVEEIVLLLNKKGIGCSIKEVLKQLNYFNEYYLLEDLNDSRYSAYFTDAYNEKFDRQLAFFGVWSHIGRHDALAFQKKLHDTHMVLIGAGGFGSEIFYCLIAMGVGNITVVDFDKVELSNLNRQSMYWEADIGKSKLEVLAEKTKEVNTSRFHFLEKKICCANDIVEIITGKDIGIIAADTPREKIFYWMNEACFKTKVPGLFTSGAAPVCIIIGPLVVPGNTSCYACSMPDIPFGYEDPLVRLINGRTKLGVISPYTRVAAGLMSLELLKHVTGFAPCQLYSQTIKMNLMNYGTSFHKNIGREACPFCGNQVHFH